MSEAENNSALTLDERVKLLISSDNERLEYFLSFIKSSQEVWSLHNGEGFVMVEGDESDCIMVWPDSDFAAQWAIDEWSDCKPTAVTLHDFQTNWLPSLDTNNLDIAIFPNIEDEGRIMKAKELLNQLTR